MTRLGFAVADARALVTVAEDADGLTGRTYNFLPSGKNTFTIVKPDDRGGYFPALVRGVGAGSDLQPFEGSLSEAYDWVYRDILERRQIYAPILDADRE